MPLEAICLTFRARGTTLRAMGIREKSVDGNIPPPPGQRAESAVDPNRHALLHTSAHLEAGAGILLHTRGAAELGERTRAGEVNAAPLLVI